ncbi:MAG: hypothetical protein ACT4O1_14305 [Gemmatimonadota bacterium]
MYRADRAVALALMLIGCSAKAPLPPVVIHLERSQIVYAPKGGTVFEGQIAPQLVFAQSLNKLLASDRLADEKTDAAWSFSMSPMVRLRMYAEASNPVRTPSYMPHFVYQRFWLRNHSTEVDPDDRVNGPYSALVTQLRLSHHSNGQDGCLYTTQIKVTVPGEDDPVCVFMPGAGADAATINLKDGSFSTNFLRARAFYRYFGLSDHPSTAADHVRRTAYVGAGVEAHRGPVLNSLPGKISDEQAELYGSWRWQLHAGGGLRTGYPRDGWLFDFTFEHAPNADASIPSWSTSLEIARTFEHLEGWGVYVRGFYGQDFYNLRFAQKIKRFHVGLGWSQERFERFAIP